MELITFESQTFKELVNKIDKIAAYISKCENPTSTEAKDIWLDSNELADLLKISTRTLQRLRKDNLISYSILRGKCLYRLSDVEESLRERLIPSDPKTLEAFRKRYMLHTKQF
ncbi:Helix-turn-helix domain-containing protein [Mariniphaga anaerophila]|uniref:Helix-turn-helix domain-containing protein n=1 Tax=Mariniphaga anaerophila TaxID=1484053 RepID=A0A1M4U1I6_9BACT|nr:helix-turn-helix domain-containing protein [Mariniphaga anaerophila]SHE50434.1 Helix-turn-helix domain-containing protein [Mariniphaga anaerophila]